MRQGGLGRRARKNDGISVPADIDGGIYTDRNWSLSILIRSELVLDVLVYVAALGGCRVWGRRHRAHSVLFDVCRCFRKFVRVVKKGIRWRKHFEGTVCLSMAQEAVGLPGCQQPRGPGNGWQDGGKWIGEADICTRLPRQNRHLRDNRSMPGRRRGFL